MLRFVTSVLLVLLVLACGPLPQQQEAQSNVGITAPDGYSVLCAAGYARTVPHFCSIDVSSGTKVLTLDSTCRNFSVSTTYGTSGTVRRLEAFLQTLIYSQNVANAVDRASVNFYIDASCTSLFIPIEHSLIEWTARPANTFLVIQNSSFPIRVVSGDTVYYSGSKAGGASTTATLYITGYYD